jgi:dTDP-L-rhamnose 4-epimerase
VPTDETKQVDLASIYALTKFMQERSCQIFGNAYGVEVVALRLFNVFGAGQALSNPYTGVLANFGARILNGQPPLVFEDGQQRRDFVHVRDVARAFRLAMESPGAAGHTINIGSGHSYTIRGVAELLAETMGVPEMGPMMLDKARAGDIRHCFADIAKARELLGYRPRHLLEDSLDELAQWIRASRAMDRGEDARRQLEARGLVA